MAEVTNRRNNQRIEDPDVGLGVAIWQSENSGETLPEEALNCCFVGICNLSDNGILIETSDPIDTMKPFLIKIYNRKKKLWQSYEGEVVWSKKDEPNAYWSGIRAREKKNIQVDFHGVPSRFMHILDNLEFFINLPLLSYLEVKSFWALMNCLKSRAVNKGDRLISQGDDVHSLFIIEKGEGRVTVEIEGEELTVASLGPRDLVGEMAILTGEPRMANVIAEDDMLLWELNRHEFERAMERFPELRTFLTELVTKRFENSPHSADRQVGNYIAKRKLGAGAWAIVYQGKHQTLNKTVAIKMLKHQMAMDAEFSRKFIREAEIIAIMNHPNIVHVYDIETLYATHFIVMEFLEGDSLEKVLRLTGKLSLHKAVLYLRQICSGLAYAHSLNIVHQDIKPDNLMVREDDTIKILDFGLACPTGSENFEMEGTIQYMSPEQIESYPVDARTDIYCLGITAFEMITGRRPYPDENLQEMMAMRLEQDVPNPADFRSDVPERLCRFIMKASARRPEDRFQTSEEAGAELDVLAKEMGLFGQQVERQHMSSLFLFFTDTQRTVLQNLLEEFSCRANESGIRLQLADFENIMEQPLGQER